MWPVNLSLAYVRKQSRWEPCAKSHDQNKNYSLYIGACEEQGYDTTTRPRENSLSEMPSEASASSSDTSECLPKVGCGASSGVSP